MVDLAEDIVLEVDWSLFCEAMRCLVDNAVKFSPPNGMVTVTFSRENDHCLINIADQGPGIEADRRDYIFTEFAIQDVGHHHQGQGISLAIVRQVVNCHNGTVTVDGEPGRGAVFTVKIPLSEG